MLFTGNSDEDGHSLLPWKLSVNRDEHHDTITSHVHTYTSTHTHTHTHTYTRLLKAGRGVKRTTWAKYVRGRKQRRGGRDICRMSSERPWQPGFAQLDNKQSLTQTPTVRKST